MRYVLATLLLILVFLKSAGQTFTIYNYSVPEGLPSSEVYEVYQDKKGFLWFATDNGVGKFDGNQMTTYHTKDGLSDPVVFGFYEDQKDRLWFRTYSGKLSYYENGQIKKYAYNDRLTKFDFSGLLNFAISDNDELWFTLRYILGKIDSSGALTTTSMAGKGLFYKTIDKTFITGVASKFLPLDTITFNNKSFPISTDELSPVYPAIQWRDKLYMAVNHGLFVFDGTTATKIFSAKHTIISLSKDREDNLWIGYLNGGISRYKDENFKERFSPLFLKDKSVTKVLQDHEGGYWFSTLESGIFHAPNLLITHFPTSSSRITGVVNVKGKIVIGDYAGNMTAFDAKKKTLLWVKPVFHPIVSLFKNKKNKVWISAKFIEVYNAEFKLEKKYFGTANHFVEDAEGSVWAFGSNNLKKFDADANLLTNDVIRTINSRAFLVDDSLKFMADRTGLKILDKNLNILTSPEGFSGVKISGITDLNDTTLFITTMGRGFMLLNKNTWQYKMYNTDNDFLADNIYSSLVTDSTVWLGTEKGLIKIPVNNLHDTLSFEYLTKKSGLINDKINFIIPVDSTIWAFTDNYFSVVPLNFSKFANRKPIFYTKEIKINDQSVKTAPNLVLDHKQNNIEISFGFISFNNPNILLRYRLSDDNNWVYSDNKKLVFSSLAPGKYLFDLQYSTDNVRWISAETGLTITIANPWWAEWYAYVGALIILLFLGYLYFLYQKSIYRQKNHYLRIINEHQQKLIQSEIVTRERERNRISKELHDRVGTNLTAIKLTVNQLLNTHREPLANDVEDQFQQAIKEIKDIIYGLTPPGLERYGLFTGLKNYINKLSRSIPVNIALKTFGTDNHRYELNIIVFRVIQELLSNTIKHSYAKNITIHMNSFEDMLNIIYEDDGIGFVYNPELNGLGLDNIESRIQSISGTLKFDSGSFGISYTIDIPATLNTEIV